MDFYTDLYSASECNSSCVEEMVCDLPGLETAQAESIHLDIKLQELTTAIQQLSVVLLSGIDGLLAEFYKQFCGLIHRGLYKAEGGQWAELPSKGTQRY